MRVFVIACLTVFKYISAFNQITKYPAVAFRAVSHLLQNKDMAVILAGERAVDSLVGAAHRIDKTEGRQAARRFLDTIPSLYLWQMQQLEHLVVNNPAIKQLVVMHSSMDTLAYELHCLRNINVIEVEERTLIQVKEDLINRKGSHIPLKAKSVKRMSSIDGIDWDVPSVVIMSENFTTLVGKLHSGSAIICTCHGKEIPDTRKFQSINVNKNGEITQITASNYIL